MTAEAKQEVNKASSSIKPNCLWLEVLSFTIHNHQSSQFSLKTMRSSTVVSACLFACTALARRLPPPSEEVRVVSWNVAASTLSPLDKKEPRERPWWNMWCSIVESSCRRPHIAHMIAEIVSTSPGDPLATAPTVVGLQGIRDDQLQDIKDGLNRESNRAVWDHVGWVRNDGDQTEAAEYNPILFRRDRLAVLDQTTEWLSPQPQASTPPGWGPRSRRLMTTAAFKDIRSNNIFIVANTQLEEDAVYTRAHEAKAVLRILQRVRDTYNRGVVLLGSFHEDSNTQVYSRLKQNLTDVWRISESKLGDRDPPMTLTDFEGIGKARHDFIWSGFNNEGFWRWPQIEVRNAKVDNMVISNHRPVIADLTIISY